MTNLKVPETVIGVVAMIILGSLVALGMNGPIKGALLAVLGHFFGRSLLAKHMKGNSN